MASHEFGIMQEAPVLGQRFDEYEPDNYHCIKVDDDVLELVAEQLCAADCYWHALDVPGKGLAYCGITLIPPASLPLMCDIIAEVPELADLHRMLIQAWKEDKYVIHYGL